MVDPVSLLPGVFFFTVGSPDGGIPALPSANLNERTLLTAMTLALVKSATGSLRNARLDHMAKSLIPRTPRSPLGSDRRLFQPTMLRGEPAFSSLLVSS